MGRLADHLVSQFAHPRGLLGPVVGRLMAVKNRERILRSLDQLDVRPTDRVLEIGFGPGVAVRELARRAAQGQVVGVDPSPRMLAQARRRNAKAVRAGQVELRLGGVSRIPYADASFDKAFTSNTTMFWPHPETDIRELARVLRPGGAVALSLQPRWAKTGTEVQAAATQLEDLLHGAGFEAVYTVTWPMKPVTALCTLGRKPG